MTNGESGLQYRETNEMPADNLTKAVGGAKLMKHLPLFGANHNVK